MKTNQAQFRKQANIAEDLLLAEKIQTGSKAEKTSAFNIIVGKYYNQVLFRINGYVHDIITAEDLTQETFAKVHTSIEKFEGKTGAFSTWINIIANNTVIDHVRKQSRFNPITFSKLSETITFEVSETETPVDVAHKKEIHTVVNKALHKTKCSKQDQRIFNNICVIGVSYDEVAETEGIPLNTIKSIVHRTKEKVKKYISTYSPDFQLAR